MSLTDFSIEPYLKEVDCSKLSGTGQFNQQFISGIGVFVTETETGKWESGMNMISCFSSENS